MKIDVETHEPQLLQALGDLINRYRPDIIIEVLPQVSEAIEASHCLKNYERFLIAEEGAIKFPKLEAFESNRDWFTFTEM